MFWGQKRSTSAEYGAIFAISLFKPKNMSLRKRGQTSKYQAVPFHFTSLQWLDPFIKHMETNMTLLPRHQHDSTKSIVGQLLIFTVSIQYTRGYYVNNVYMEPMNKPTCRPH